MRLEVDQRGSDKHLRGILGMADNVTDVAGEEMKHSWMNKCAPRRYWSVIRIRMMRLMLT
jgi:hypothetical protein